MTTDTDLFMIQGYLQLADRLHTAGQPTAGQLGRLRAQGIEAVINLALPTSDDAVDKEAAILTGQGIAYCHLPVDWERPEEEDFALFADIFAATRSRNLLVHCAKNMRVSAFIYLYRITREGMSHEAACRDLFRIWVPYDQWHGFINRVRTGHGLAAAYFEHP